MNKYIYIFILPKFDLILQSQMKNRQIDHLFFIISNNAINMMVSLNNFTVLSNLERMAIWKLEIY